MQRELPMIQQQRLAEGIALNRELLGGKGQAAADAFEIGFLQDPLFEKTRWVIGEKRLLDGREEMAGDQIDVNVAGGFLGVYSNLAGPADQTDHQAGGAGQIEMQGMEICGRSDRRLAVSVVRESPCRRVDAGVMRQGRSAEGAGDEVSMSQRGGAISLVAGLLRRREPGEALSFQRVRRN